MATHVFRVIVRGRFGELDETTRERLLADVDDHEAMRAAFTRDGTLTYDRRLDFFSFRYEVRVSVDDGPEPSSTPSDATEVAFAEAVRRADEHLSVRGLSYRHLEPTGSDLTRIWETERTEGSAARGRT